MGRRSPGGKRPRGDGIGGRDVRKHCNVVVGITHRHDLGKSNSQPIRQNLDALGLAPSFRNYIYLRDRPRLNKIDILEPLREARHKMRHLLRAAGALDVRLFRSDGADMGHTSRPASVLRSVVPLKARRPSRKGHDVAALIKEEVGSRGVSVEKRRNGLQPLGRHRLLVCEPAVHVDHLAVDKGPRRTPNRTPCKHSHGIVPDTSRDRSKETPRRHKTADGLSRSLRQPRCAARNQSIIYIRDHQAHVRTHDAPS